MSNKSSLFVYSLARVTYQLAGFIFVLLSRRYLPPLEAFISLRPVCSFTAAASSLNLDGGFLRLWASSPSFTSAFSSLTNLKILVLPFISVIISLFLWSSHIVNQSLSVILGCVGISVVSYMCLSMQSVFFWLDDEISFAKIFFLPLTFFYVLAFCLFVFFSVYINSSLILPFFLVSFSFVLLLILLTLLHHIPYSFSIPSFPFFRSLVGPAFASYLVSQSANLIELIPFLIASKNQPVSQTANLSLAVQFYFAFLITPFLEKLKKVLVTGQLNSFSSKDLLLALLSRINIYFLFLFAIVLLYIFSSYSSLLAFYKPIIISFFLISLLLPVSLFRSVLLYKLLLNPLSPLFPMLIFWFFAILLSLFATVHDFRCIYILILAFELAFITSIAIGASAIGGTSPVSR